MKWNEIELKKHGKMQTTAVHTHNQHIRQQTLQNFPDTWNLEEDFRIELRHGLLCKN